MSDPQLTLPHRVSRYIRAGKLSAAIALLIDTASALIDSDMTSRLRRIESIYHSMRHYFMQGLPDETRHAQLADIRFELMQAATILQDLTDEKGSTLQYHAVRRMLRLHPRTLDTLLADYAKARTDMMVKEIQGNMIDADRSTRELALNSIFEYVWTLGANHASELRRIKETVLSDSTDTSLRYQLLTALFFAASTLYDSEKMLTLIDIYEKTEDQSLAARALTSIVLAVWAQREMVKEDRKVLTRLQAWQDSILEYGRLREILMAVIRTADVKILEKGMNDEILPELKKMKSRLDEMKKDGEAVDIINEEGEVNPEWDRIMQESGLEQRMRELSEMQEEGSDIMMVTFSQLKTFPFFNTMSNWFLPFDTSHSHLRELREMDSALFETILEQESPFCDSDKYSFSFAFCSLPRQQREMMMGQLNQAMDQAQEMIREARQKSARPEFDEAVNRYIRDLHRFYKYYRNRGEYSNPFASSFPFQELPVIGEILSEEETVTLVAEYYFKRRLTSDALPLFESLSRERGDNGTLWEKLGYCYENAGMHEEALKRYTTAEFFNPESKWIMRRMAWCNHITGHYDTAAEYTRRLLQQSPDSLNLLLHLASSLEKAGKHDEALEIYFKVDYLKGGDPAVWRYITWGEMQRGNLEKARKYLVKSMIDGTTVEDALYEGHLHVLSGKYTEAVESYARAIQMYKEEHRDSEESAARLKRRIELRIRTQLTDLGVADSDLLDLLLDA